MTHKVSIYEQDSDGVPSKYLLKKQVKIKSVKSEQKLLLLCKKYNSLVLSNPNVTEVILYLIVMGKIGLRLTF